MSNILKLCRWYESHWIEDIHEDVGIKIDTLDNPGWSLMIDLDGSELHKRAFNEIKIERSEHDWIVARREGDVFEAFGGPMNLDEMIGIFLVWAE
jgi:phosphopantothenoylcysteine synthetase/decarboxylase